MTTTSTEHDRGAFDHPDNLNEDGTITFKIVPSAWHAYSVCPDTYQTVNGDGFDEMELYNLNEVLAYPEHYSLSDHFKGLDYLVGTDFEFEYDDFDWEYDHREIVRQFAEVCADWIAATLDEAGLKLEEYKVTDSWSPKFYNFTSDGFEMEITCDPAKLRELTPDFDVDDWAHEHYRSYDGFMSFVTSRIKHDDWHQVYDGEFRVEALLLSQDPYHERGWITDLAEAEHEIYAENTTITPRVEDIRERFLAEGHAFMDSAYTEAELDEWAQECEHDFRWADEPMFGESL